MIVELIEDKNGDLILPLGDELCNEVGWKVGDTIEWIDNGDGSWTMRKKEMEKELVLVECVSTFRMRYVVEVPKGKKEWAMDTVVMNDAEEMSQEHLGEQIVSHRVITEEEFLQVFDEDNDYCKSWTNDLKLRCVKRWDDDEAEANAFTEQAAEDTLKDIDHSAYWFDTSRNK
jgi:hypothetical protein